MPFGQASLRFAVPPTLGPDSAERHKLLEGYLSRALGRSVAVATPPSYELLAKELLSGKVEAAWVPPFVCARIEAMGVRVLVRGVRDGASTYRSALVARADSTFSLEGLSGATASWSDRDSVAGYLLPLAYMRERGLDLSKAFSRQDFAGSYRAALEAVASGKADVTSVFAPAAKGDQPARTGIEQLWPERQDAFRVVAFTAESPNDGVAGAMSAPASVLTELERVLLGMHQDAQGRDVVLQAFRCERFEVAPRMGYRALYRVALASL